MASGGCNLVRLAIYFFPLELFERAPRLLENLTAKLLFLDLTDKWRGFALSKSLIEGASEYPSPIVRSCLNINDIERSFDKDSAALIY